MALAERIKVPRSTKEFTAGLCGDFINSDRVTLLIKRQSSEAPLSNDGALAEGRKVPRSTKEFTAEICGNFVNSDRVALLIKRQSSEAPLSNDVALAKGRKVPRSAIGIYHRDRRCESDFRVRIRVLYILGFEMFHDLVG